MTTVDGPCPTFGFSDFGDLDQHCIIQQPSAPPLFRLSVIVCP